MKYDEQDTLDFAIRMKSFGFRAFIAERKNYGYFTDAEGTRVVSFGGSVFSGLSGNYKSTENRDGSGWKMYVDLCDVKTKEDAQALLNAYPPSWCGIKGKITMRTEESYRAIYQDSSRFTQI